MWTALQLGDRLNTWLAATAGGAWPSERERLDDVEKVVNRRPGTAHRGKWRVQSQEQQAGEPGRPGGYQTVYVVARDDDGGVYDSTSQKRAEAMAEALNALEAHLAGVLR